MHPDKRRAGRRIRKQRRQFRKIGQTFARLGEAALIATSNFNMFAIAIREAVRREGELARVAVEEGTE